MLFNKLALIGCGLIGGSFALALKRAKCVAHISGFSASEHSRAKALELGVIDQSAPSIKEALQGADLVLVAVPVNAMTTCLESVEAHLSPGALIMDVGSTKNEIIEAAQKAMPVHFSSFVPAHPIAGKELHGVEHAEAQLFDHHQTILTPNSKTDPQKIELAIKAWEAVGSTVSVMTPQEHDQALAAVSHLPHLIAFAAVNAISRQDQNEMILSLAGPGFRDFSRIAASAPSVWLDIFMSNQAEVLEQLQMFKMALAEFEDALRDQDPQRITRLIESASEVRKKWVPPGAQPQR